MPHADAHAASSIQAAFADVLMRRGVFQAAHLIVDLQVRSSDGDMLCFVQTSAVCKQPLHTADHEAWVAGRSNHGVSLATACRAICKDSAVVAADDVSDHRSDCCTEHVAVGAVITKCQVKRILLLLQGSKAETERCAIRQ